MLTAVLELRSPVLELTDLDRELLDLASELPDQAFPNPKTPQQELQVEFRPGLGTPAAWAPPSASGTCPPVSRCKLPGPELTVVP